MQAAAETAATSARVTAGSRGDERSPSRRDSHALQDRPCLPSLPAHLQCIRWNHHSSHAVAAEPKNTLKTAEPQLQALAELPSRAPRAHARGSHPGCRAGRGGPPGTWRSHCPCCPCPSSRRWRRRRHGRRLRVQVGRGGGARRESGRHAVKPIKWWADEQRPAPLVPRLAQQQQCSGQVFARAAGARCRCAAAAAARRRGGWTQPASVPAQTSSASSAAQTVLLARILMSRGCEAAEERGCAAADSCLLQGCDSSPPPPPPSLLWRRTALCRTLEPSPVTPGGGGTCAPAAAVPPHQPHPPAGPPHPLRVGRGR